MSLSKRAKLKFLLDENIRFELVKFFKVKGVDVSVVPKGVTNSQVVLRARREKRVLLTHDSDFADPALHPPKDYPGIVVLRIHPPVMEKLEKALTALLTKVRPSEFAGKLFVVSEEGFKVVELPR